MRVGIFVFFTLLILYANLAMGAGKLVFIGAEEPGGANDQAFIMAFQEFEGLDLAVEYHSQAEAHPVDLSGAALVFIYESVSSGEIGDAYRDVKVPVIFTEHALIEAYAIMGMTKAAEGNPDQDTSYSVSYTIVDSTHLITQGFKDEVTVCLGNNRIQGSLERSAVQGDVQILAI